MTMVRKMSGACCRRASLLPLGLLAAALTAPAEAGDIAAGKTSAAGCVVCHGAFGVSQMPSAPHLAGQPAIYVAEQMKNYRSGKRSHEIMSVIAKPLSDTEIDNLAAWFESIRIEAQPR
jgi:cytochrome c553